MNTHKKLEDALSLLIHTTRDCDQQVEKQCMVSMTPHIFCRESRTVRVAVRRQAGITTSTIKILSQFWKRPLWAAGTSRMIPYVQRIAEEVRVELKIKNVHDVARMDLSSEDKQPDCIVIDPASFIKEKTVKKIYNNFYNVCRQNPNFLFVLIG